MTITQSSLFPVPAPDLSTGFAGASRGSAEPVNLGGDVNAGRAVKDGQGGCTCQRDENRESAGNVVELYPAVREATVRRPRLTASEAGMATAEYAIATLAAVGFAGLLVFILRSDEVRGFLLNLIRTALALP
ncbi:DUF4244 domain-containing protein [Pseudarthrobacter sulfonivorans]|uniref:DUF4244 domain-containing protein n=1 Tax=Pseudarthrobacter sulfonivorans TaxID=121292 RepID=UPI00210791F3|nr:DUF4244 domain-containing protein [Pseudarthrobacter sulfonivorans]